MSHPKLANNRTLDILSAASRGNYAVASPVVYNISHILGSIKAAESLNAPIIIEMFPWAVTWSSGLLVHAAAQAAKQASVPVSIHLDHAQDEDMIRHCADSLPFDSIMVDMSKYERDENLRRTKELSNYCHERGISVEAEPGRIEGGEDGIVDTGALEAIKTTVEDVDDFLAAGVDILAPAIGNVHGGYPPEGAQLDMTRLEEITKRTSGKMQLALHGSTDVPTGMLKDCIAKGVTKVNVNKAYLIDYMKHFRQDSPSQPLTQFLEESVPLVQRRLEDLIKICGSDNKAGPVGV